MGKWARRLLWVALLVGTLSAAALLGASSVRTWMELNDQQVVAGQEAADLDRRIVELEREIDRRTGAEAVRQAALCFGPYVEPGREVYTILGLEGCVAHAGSG